MMKKNLFSIKKMFSALLLAGATTVSAQTGAALKFDGVDDRVNLGTAISTSLTGQNKLTIEAWVNPSSSVGLNNIIGNYNTANNNNMQFLLRQNAAADYQFWIGNTTNNQYSVCISTAAPTVGIWQHVAGVWDNGAMAIYINGVLSGTANISFNQLNANSAPVVIGNNSISENFDGSIDEIRIWRSARTACEIQSYMNCEISTSAPNLLANYHFNQGIAGGNNATQTTLQDASGNGLSGSLLSFALTGTFSNWVAPGGVVSGSTTPAAAAIPTISANPGFTVCSNSTVALTGTLSGATYTWTGGISNGVAFTPTAPITTYTLNASNPTGCSGSSVVSVYVAACSGTAGAALHFDGTDAVNCGTTISNVLVGGNKLTIEAWTKPSAGSGLRNIIGNYHTGNGPNMQFLLRNGNNAGYEFFIGNGINLDYTVALSSTAPTVGVWQHLAGVWDGTVASLYVNGVLSGTASVPMASFNPQPSPVIIGSNNINENYFGELDEIRVWNVARSACDINANMNAELAGPMSGLVAYYRFNQGFAAALNTTATVLPDASGNNNQGALTTFSLNGITSNWSAPGAVVSGSVNTSLNPSISIASSNSLLCAGSSATITASGTATAYNWVNLGAGASIVVSPSVTTSYTVNGTDNQGCSNLVSFTQSVTVCSGLNESLSNPKISIYPNPSQGDITILSEQEGAVTIYNSIGTLVKQYIIGSGANSLKLSNLPKGIYLIEFINVNSKYTSRLIIN